MNNQDNQINQNNQQPICPKFCEKCGAQLPPNIQACPNCGFPVSANYLLSTNNPTTLLPSNSNTNSPKVKNKKKIIIPIVILVIIIAIATTIFILFETHTICIDHKWKKADCTTPKTCQYCNKTEGEALGHDWTEATCTEDSVCMRCDEIGIKAAGHTKGVWTKTKEATLVDVGVEEIFCIACSESLDSRGTERKKPKVVDSSFNFKDSEFIDWLEDNSTLEVGSKQTLNSNMNTAYLITNSEGKTGALLLNHGNNGLSGDVCGIMIYFENSTYSIATATYIGEKFDSSFSKEDAAIKLFNDQSYSKADMSVMMIDVQGMSTVALAPTAFFDDLAS